MDPAIPDAKHFFITNPERGGMKIYVAGPMRGIPEFNFPAFHAATARLRAEGHEVFNPAERDIAHHGTDISKGNATGDEKLATEQHGFNLREALKDDLEFICLHADAIAVLPGWENSKGAQAEVATARALGLVIFQSGEVAANATTADILMRDYK